MAFDDIDLKILELLCNDGRLSHAAIGKEIDMTGPAVYARVQRLEREDVIKGYTTLLNPEKVGCGLAAFIRVVIKEGQESEEDVLRFEQFVRDEPQILECHDITGEDSYILKVRTGSPQSLRALLAKLRMLAGVTHTVSSIVLTTVKEGNVKGPPAPSPKS